MRCASVAWSFDCASARCAAISGAISLIMTCPIFTTDPRSTLIESTNAVTLGKKATCSYGCNSPGSRTAIANSRDSTAATSTVGVGVDEACALLLDSDDTELLLQDEQREIVPPRATM